MRKKTVPFSWMYKQIIIYYTSKLILYKTVLGILLYYSMNDIISVDMFRKWSQLYKKHEVLKTQKS